MMLPEPSHYRELQRRAFQGLMLSSRIEAMEQRGELVVRADVPVASELLGRFEPFVSPGIVERLASVTHAFALFYSFENMAREFVIQRLNETKGANWFDSSAVPNGVKTRVKAQKESAAKNKWHEVEVMSDMSYTLFGDLLAIIDQNWTEFKDFFPDQHWVKTRLEELERSRNAIMHGRTLPPSEIARIEQYFDDWIDQVG